MTAGTTMNSHARAGAMVRGSAILLALWTSVGWAVAAEPVRVFDIEQQPLAAALSQFAQQSDRPILFTTEVVGAKHSRGVKGEWQPEVALEKLLKGTGLTFRVTADRTILVGKPGDTANIPAAAGPMRLAQVAGSESASSRTERTTSGESNETPQSRIELEEIVVTGTNIRGITNRTAPMQSYDRETLERSGYSTADQFIKTLPQEFRGGVNGANEDGKIAGAVNSPLNHEGAVGFNLRGLGNASTLVLFNGRRMAPAAVGSFTDVSMIPLAALERVDVVTDGSSAIYGGDAVGGVVNFVTRRDYSGAETTVRYSDTAHSDMREFLGSQALGAQWSTGNVVAALQYVDRTPLRSSERSFTANTPQPTDLTPDTEKYSGFLSVGQNLPGGFDIFGDVFAARRDVMALRSTSPTNGIDTDVDAEQFSANVGVGLQAFDDWRFELTANTGSMTSDVKFPRYLPTPAGYVQGTLGLSSRAEVTAFELKSDDVLFDLPAGAVKAAVGAGTRDEEFRSLIPYLAASNTNRLRANQRDVDWAFAEIYVPLLHQLDLSAAVRWDDYSDFGDTTNPKIGLRYSPTQSLTLRSTWSTSFRAPNGNELLNQSLGQFISGTRLAAPAGGTANVFLLSGLSRDIEAEQARSWSAGIEFLPERVLGLSLGVNYYQIDFTDRIVLPPFVSTILAQPSVYGSLITPLADDAEAAAYLAARLAEGYTYADPLGIGSAGVRYIVNVQLQNAAFVEQSGADLIARYNFSVGANRFDAGVNFSWIREIVTALTRQSRPTDIADTYANPISKRIRLDFGWTRGDWQINSAVNYRGSYTDTSTITFPQVSAWTTVDLNLRYTPTGIADSSLFSNLSVGLSASNLLDKDPPYVNGSSVATAQANIHYDSGNADPYGRQVSLEVRKRW